jgi:hypothetical protein
LYLEQCEAGTWVVKESCTSVCDAALGCIGCDPAEPLACSGNDVHSCNADGSLGDYILSCDPQACSKGECIDDNCAAGTDLIYVVDQAQQLLSFDPRIPAFAPIGTLNCPAGASWPSWPGGAAVTPFSMSVDRSGQAWVLYTSGEVFLVDIEDASCVASAYVKGQGGVELFGMGFVTDGPGELTEKLFIAGGSGAIPQATDVTFGSVLPATAVLTTLGTTDVVEWPPELTGTGNGKVYGYFPGTMTTTVQELNRTNGTSIQSWELGGLGAAVRAWAFAHWGGKFYIFVTTDVMGDLVTNVMKFDPVAGPPATTLLADVPYTIVGAGVSTCAPVID